MSHWDTLAWGSSVCSSSSPVSSRWLLPAYLHPTTTQFPPTLHAAHQPGACASPSTPTQCRLPSWASKQYCGEQDPTATAAGEERDPRDDRLSIADPRQAMQVLEANPKVRPGGQVAVRPGHWLLRHPHLHVQVFVQHLLELHVFKLVALYTI